MYVSSSRKAIGFIDFMLIIIKTILLEGAVALSASVNFWKGLGGSKPSGVTYNMIVARS